MFWYSKTKFHYPGQFAKRNKNTVIDMAGIEPRSEVFVSLHRAFFFFQSALQNLPCNSTPTQFSSSTLGTTVCCTVFLAHCDRVLTYNTIKYQQGTLIKAYLLKIPNVLEVRHRRGHTVFYNS
jgi:hypothetical protein